MHKDYSIFTSFKRRGPAGFYSSHYRLNFQITGLRPEPVVCIAINYPALLSPMGYLLLKTHVHFSGDSTVISLKYTQLNSLFVAPCASKTDTRRSTCRATEPLQREPAADWCDFLFRGQKPIEFRSGPS